MYLIIIVNILFVVLTMAFAQCQPAYLFDLPTLLLLFLILIPTILGTGTGKDLMNAFRIGFSRTKSYSLIELKRAEETINLGIKMLFLTGGLMALLDCLIILHELSSLSELGPRCAMIVVSMLYALFFSMIFMPLKVIIHNRIISYMDENEADETIQNEDMGQRIYYRLRSFGLTDREAEVARLVSQGMSNKEIGKELFITETTVKKHVTHILDKMKLENREALTRIISEI